MGKSDGIFPEAVLFGSGTLNPKSETASRGAVDLQIVGAGMGEQIFDDGLEFAVRHVFLGQKAAAMRVGFDRTRAAAKLLGKSGVFQITRASIRVNVDGAGLWKRFDTRETVIGKKYSAVLAYDKGA